MNTLPALGNDWVLSNRRKNTSLLIHPVTPPLPPHLFHSPILPLSPPFFFFCAWHSIYLSHCSWAHRLWSHTCWVQIPTPPLGCWGIWGWDLTSFPIIYRWLDKVRVGTAILHRAAAKTEEKVLAQCLVETHGSVTGRAVTGTHSLPALVLRTVRYGPQTERLA